MRTQFYGQDSYDKKFKSLTITTSPHEPQFVPIACARESDRCFVFSFKNQTLFFGTLLAPILRKALSSLAEKPIRKESKNNGVHSKRISPIH